MGRKHGFNDMIFISLPRSPAIRWRLRLLLLLARQSSSKHGFALTRSSNLKEGEFSFPSLLLPSQAVLTYLGKVQHD